MTAREHATEAAALLMSDSIEFVNRSSGGADLIIAWAQAHALTAIALHLTGGPPAHDLPVKLTGWDGDYPLPIVNRGG